MAKTQAQMRKEYEMRNQRVNGSTSNLNHGNQQNFTKPVAVPYNFVRLPKQVIPAEFWKSDSSKDMTALYKEHVLTNGKNLGYIDIDILTQTPLFIGGNVVKKNGEEYQEFFGGNDNPIIPGSSLKSMIKQILKITTSSGFRAYDSKLGTGDFEDRHLYFRALGSPVKNFRKYYNDTMVESNAAKKESITRALAGFIVKTVDHNFYVVNAKFDILKYKTHSKSGFQPKTASIDWQNGYVDIHTGFMNNKRSFVRIHKPGNFLNSRIPIPEDVINSYNYDINRKTIDLLEIDKSENAKFVKPGKSGIEAKKYTNCSDITYVVPCFYKTNGNVVEHFGHGRFYRIAYHSSIKSCLPEPMKLQNHIVDLTDSILGYASTWAGRVSFSEAHLADRPKWCEFSKPQPLMEPKPTSFQFYLKQDTDNSNSPHNHWDSPNATIRGYKLYWHQPIRKENSWKNSSDKVGDKLSKYIQPIDSGVTFKSRIYFDNLSDVELGALLLTLNLDRLYTEGDEEKSICYKLGKGKSIGLGSIKLNSSLHILDRDKRYNTLFDKNTWQLGETDISKDTFINAFLKYRNDSLGGNLSDYNQMLEELLTMMNWNLAKGTREIPISKWKEAMTMMSVDNDDYKRFKNRVKLGTPKEFIDAWSKK